MVAFICLFSYSLNLLCSVSQANVDHRWYFRFLLFFSIQQRQIWINVVCLFEVTITLCSFMSTIYISVCWCIYCDLLS